jgi:hypothetical protein
MAGKTWADLEAQLEAARQRLDPISVEGGFWNIRRRIEALERALQDLGKEGARNEFFRHFPVAAIAVLESHFRESIASVVNSNVECIERGLELIREKRITPTEILVLHKGPTTIGDVVARLLPFSAIDHVLSVYGKLLGGDLKGLLAAVEDPYAKRMERPNRKPIITDVDDLLRALSQTFDKRHILAHEASPLFEVTRSDAERALWSVKTCIEGVDAVLWSTVWVDKPLTQREKNDAACVSMRSARQELAKAIWYLRPTGTGFRKSHALWRRYFKDSLSLLSEMSMGSIRPLVVCSSAEHMLRARMWDIRPVFGKRSAE